MRAVVTKTFVQGTHVRERRNATKKLLAARTEKHCTAERPDMGQLNLTHRVTNMKVGDKVKIVDYSDAHGDIGVIDTIQKNGIILVELEQGCIWPVTEGEIVLADE